MRYFLFVLWLVPALAVAAPPAGTPMDADELKELLGQLEEAQGWGEAVFADGSRRAVQVQGVEGDSVAVVEVFGALHQRDRRYALGQFHSLRDLGPQRIAPRHAAFGRRKSTTVAMVLETVPGLGYLYAGQTRMALGMWTVTGAAAATAFFTKKDGAAAWVPLGTWIKLASHLNLYEDVKAMNRSYNDGFSLDVAPGDGWKGRLSYRF